MEYPTERDLARWAKWADLRERQCAATSEDERLTLALEEEHLREEGIAELLEQDLSSDQSWFWLSFADEGGFLGVAIIQAGGIMEATIAARTRGINPGGEVRAWAIDIDRVDERYRNRLLSEDDLREAGLI